MRAPTRRNGSSPLVRQAPPRSELQNLNRNITLLLLFLAVAVVSSFGSAYYLFATRWARRPVSVNNSSEADASYKANEFTVFNDQVGLSPEKKYLSYLPHSGFHNQRIAFENALVLAFILRRTLLVPPIRLANKPIRYVEFDTLVQHHELASKEGLQHCPRIAPYLSRPLECLAYFESSYLPWSWLVNLSAIVDSPPLIQLSNVSQRSLHDHLHLEDKDVYTMRDYSPYQFRFLDTDSGSSPPKDRYSHAIHLSRLVHVQVRLLQIGTLFGSSRLRLKDPKNLAFQRTVRKAMIFTNQDLSRVVESISMALGSHFLAVHIRTGDGYFKSETERTVESIWRDLLQGVFEFSTDEICRLQRMLSGTTRNCSKQPVCVGNCSHMAIVSSTPRPAKRECRFPLHRDPAYELLNTPLYVATDLRRPESDPTLLLLRRTFPCIFFLRDFPGELQQLESLTSPFDGVHIHPFLLPFIDAMVAGKALAVVGTQGSTFSGYVTRLWQFYHEASGLLSNHSLFNP